MSIDFSARLQFLESIHDWQGLVEELEARIASTNDAPERAALHLRVGHVLDDKFMQAARALKHFQDAFKQSPALIEALTAARAIYWELGKVNMVQKLLELELKSIHEGEGAARRLIELGDVLCDAGEIERAMATYARALGASAGASDDARKRLEDVQVDAATWSARLDQLAAEAEDGSISGSARAATFLRAMRIAKRFAPERVEALAARAYEADPGDRQAATVFEGILSQEERLSALRELQRRVLDRLQPAERARYAFLYGSRWASKHHDTELSAALIAEALTLDPSNEAAFVFLREQWGTREGDWAKVVATAEAAVAAGSTSPMIVSQAGLLAWKQLGDIGRAGAAFAKLAELMPDHPALSDYAAQTGQTVGAQTMSTDEPVADETGQEAELKGEEEAVVDESELVAAPPVEAPQEEEAPEPAAAPTAEVAPAASVPPPAAPPAAAPAPAVEAAPEIAPVDQEKIDELLARAEKQQQARRFNEYVKTLVELAETVGQPEEKIEYYRQAAEIFTSKFSNTAEAVRCYEAILAIDGNHAEAIDFLRQSYEKRRDWEKLIGLSRREASNLPMGAERAERFLEIARLATERVKKPDVCIELWREVIDSDPANDEALTNLGNLYERAKEWENLGEVLKKQADATFDEQAKQTIYAKLGQLYGDRLDNDEAAVDAWQKLLALNPQDRRAQEALKKKYLALGRWDDLEVFYAESGKWDEFIRLLEAQESKEKDDQAKISLLLKTAQLWITQKGKVDRAAKAYEKILTIDERHLGAAEALIPLYTSAGNAKGLASAIEVKLSHDIDAATKLELYREVASIYETKLKEVERAFERYLAAFDLAPDNAECVSDVERVAGAANAWDALIAAYGKAIARAEEAGDKVLGIDLRLRLGRVLLEEVAKPADALAQYSAVYEIDDENADAMAALERLYREMGRFEDLLGVYEKKRALTTDDDERKRIAYAVAGLFEKELGDAGRATATYEQVIEEDPADSTALSALDRLYREQQRWEAYGDVLRRRIELDVPEAELIDLKLRLGATLEKHLDDAAGALLNYREILLLDSGNDPARLALEALLEKPELRAEAAEILQEIYEGRGDFEKLIGTLEILASVAAAPAERVALLRKAARVSADSLNDLARAFDAQARALQEDPTNADSQRELEAFAAEAGSWDKLDTVLSGIAATLTDPSLAREYWMRLGAIDERLGKIDEAASRYDQVLAIDPADADALAAMDTLYRGAGRWDDLVSVFRRRIDLQTDVDAREALYGQMAEVYETKLGRPEEAVAAYREVLSTDPASRAALAALDGLFSRLGLWDELADNLDAQLRLADTEEEQTMLMLRLALLREQRMGLVADAIEIYRQVLDRDPSNADALAALERLGKNAEHELAISEILEPLYRHSGDYQRLIGVYEVQVRRTDDANRRVDLLHEIATLYEDAGGDLGAAFDTQARALAMDPGSEATQVALDRLARATGRFADLAKVYEELAATQEDPLLSCALFAMSARVYEDTGDVESAVRHYRRVLEIDGRNLAAAESLENIFRATERYQELGLVLQQKADIVDEPTEKKSALFQAASIAEDVLERPAEAIAVYGRVLDLDPEDVRAIDALIKLYLDLSRWQDLLGVYQRKADLIGDPDEKKQIYYEMGAVYERELGDVANAIDTYQRVLELDPDDLQSLGRLDVLYQTSGNWAELLSVLNHEAELASDPLEALGFQYRVAELYEKRLDDIARAIELYRELLQQMPDHQPTLAALEGIMRGNRDPLGAATVLEPFYDAMGEWSKLIEVLEVQAVAAEDAYAKVDLYHRIARLYEDMLTDHASAFSTYARAVAADIANDESLANLERLAMATGGWLNVASLYDQELAKLGEDPARYVELALRLAQIYETQIEDFDAAIGRYRAVLEVEPHSRAALTSLDRLFSQTERWAELAAILTREAEIAESEDEALDAKFRLGEVYQGRLGDIDAAIAAYKDVLAVAPDHGFTLSALEGLFSSGVKQLEIGEILGPLYESAGEWDKLTSVLEAELAHITDRDARVTMLHRLAELNEEQLLAPDAALAVHVRVLREVPLQERSIDDVERLAGIVDSGWEQLANAYADVLGLHADPPVQAAIGKRLARLFEEELGDVQKAEETYRYVLGVDPTDVEGLANLDRIYSSLEQYPELAQVLEQRVRATAEPYELVELYERLGQVYEEQLQQVPEAITAYRRIFDELDPTNEQASEALERLYSVSGAWGELRAVLDRQLERASGDEAEAAIQSKLARVLAVSLGDIPGSIEKWKRVLDLRGEDAEALAGLSDLYERTESWAELCDVLERHYDIAADDESRVAVLLRRAELYTTRLDRDDAALDDYARVLDIDYANLQALYAIADIWRRRNDANELVLALHQIVDRAAASLPPENLVALFREIGTTYQEALGQAYEASEAWRRLLEVDPHDFDAMAALETLLRAEDRWNEVIDVKMARAGAFEAPEEQIREYTEVAQIWEHQVGQKDKATPAFERILEIDNTNDDAFNALEQLHTAAGRAEPLIELYLARLDTRESTADKTRLLRKVAKVFETQLDDKTQAFDALFTAFELDFEDMETVRYLERMAQATNRWGELIQAVQGWLKQQTEPRGKITLSLRLAKWYAEDIGRPDYAQPYYQQVLALDPNNATVLRQMANFFKKGGNWQQQGQMLTQAYNVAVTDVDRKEILTELGEVLERRMNDVEQGLSYYKRALDVDPLHVPALEALERIYGDRGDSAELVDVLTRKARGLTDPEEIASVKLRAGGLYETTLGQIDKAGQVYREVIEIDASNVLAMRGLERVYATTGQWPDLVKVLEMQLDVVTTERERIEVLSKIAQIQEDQFLKPDLAAARYEQAVEIDPNNEFALEGLERCYRRLRQWLDLINAYDRHINATLDRQKKIELWSQIAQTYAIEVQDVDRAIDSYLNITEIDDANVPALEALSKLYEKQDDPARAIEYMTRVADLSVDGRQRVEMYYRIGRQLDEKLGDRVQAQERYEMALDLDPAHVPTLAALRAIAMDSSDWDRAARYLDQEQMYTEAPRARAKLLVELGRLREEMLGEPDLAMQAYELAQQCDADNEEAAFPLLNAYVAREDYAHAEPLAEMLARKAGRRERSEQHHLHNLLGKVLFKLGKMEGALKAFQTAHTLDLTNHETIRGLADVCFELSDWPGALTNYQKVLTILGEEEAEERANVYYRLGRIKAAQGQAKQAISNYDKALGIDGAHRPTLEALVEAYEAQRDFAQACTFRQAIVDNVFDASERFKMLNELADAWADKAMMPDRAVTALEQALDIEPQNHVLLHKLLQLYQKTSQWSQMVDCLQRIADIETNPERKSRYLYTMAQLYRDKLDDQTRAVELFNDALDLNPTFLEAFERINKILTAQKEWKQLERAYRRMLHRVAGKGNNELEFNLWHALGLIYRDRLREPTSAIETFRMASRLRPENGQEHQILAELYEAVDQGEHAVAEYQAMLKLDPMKIDPYRKLYGLYLAQKEYDKAWCLASALAFLRKADEEEMRFYEDYKPQGMLPVKHVINNEQWVRNLFHEEEDLYIGKIFDMMAKAALRAKIETLKAKKETPVLDARFRQDPATSTVTFARTFGWAAQVLGIGCPLLYVRSDVPGALAAVATEPPASVAGQTVLTGFQPQELTFICGKHLAMYRGEHYIKTLFPTVTELTVLLFAGIKLVAPETPVPGDIEKQIVATAQMLRQHMEPVQLENLRTVVRKFIAEGAKANIKRWVQTVEVTAARAGLLLCADLETAKKIIAVEPQQPGDLPAQEKVKELLVFSVSEQYFTLRQALGVGVGVEA